MPSNPIKLREAIAELRTAIHAYRESPNNARHYIDEAAENLLEALDAIITPCDFEMIE